MATNISHSPADTAALGEQWGRAAQSGLVIGLSGDLGAGKTQFVKGLARGLGITMRVQSPSYVLVNIYTGGRLTLFHLDLYRLDTPEQVTAAGMEEYLQPTGVTVIEWVERWLGEGRMQNVECRVQNVVGMGQVQQLRRVQIEVLNETERRINYEDTVV